MTLMLYPTLFLKCKLEPLFFYFAVHYAGLEEKSIAVVDFLCITCLALKVNVSVHQLVLECR